MELCMKVLYMFIQYYNNNTRSFIVNSFQHFVLYPSPAIKAIRPPPVRYLQNIAGLSYQQITLKRSTASRSKRRVTLTLMALSSLVITVR